MEPPRLEPETAHVFRIDLERLPSGCADLAAVLSILSEDERRRADLFAREELRRRYAVGHAHLRRILSRYLAVPPEQIELRAGTHGKPFVPGAPLGFNLSHSRGLGLCAIAPGDVGVDVEAIRPLRDM